VPSAGPMGTAMNATLAISWIQPPKHASKYSPEKYQDLVVIVLFAELEIIWCLPKIPNSSVPHAHIDARNAISKELM